MGSEIINDLTRKEPILAKISAAEQVFWLNDGYVPNEALPVKGWGAELIEDAALRFKRYGPILEKLFSIDGGRVNSPMSRIPRMKQTLEKEYGQEIKGDLFLKRDDLLPVAGSIKARGGFHEVLAHAENLATKAGLLHPDANQLELLSSETASLFARQEISVGSTGNLGLSIGLLGSALGFKVTVHMSVDAKQWKKNLLHAKGVRVVEHEKDYSAAVAAARNMSGKSENSYFIDDEDSKLLFAGYAAAAQEVKEQLTDNQIEIGPGSPLIVYLPCGVGGGPGGVTFGLKHVFGEHVHCFFAEPVQAPAMLAGLVTGRHHQISARDFGLTGMTIADGLAVSRPSAFVGEIMESLLAGIFTVSDEELVKYLRQLYTHEDIFLEPSALAGMIGPVLIHSLEKKQKQKYSVTNATHLVWATGGSLVPDSERGKFIV